jgi:hypothetical protein
MITVMTRIVAPPESEWTHFGRSDFARDIDGRGRPHVVRRHRALWMAASACRPRRLLYGAKPETTHGRPVLYKGGSILTAELRPPLSMPPILGQLGVPMHEAQLPTTSGPSLSRSSMHTIFNSSGV